MNTKEKMNVLVLGASGAGKSTLINAVSGARIITGVSDEKLVYDHTLAALIIQCAINCRR